MFIISDAVMLPREVSSLWALSQTKTTTHPIVSSKPYQVWMALLGIAAYLHDGVVPLSLLQRPSTTWPATSKAFNLNLWKVAGLSQEGCINHLKQISPFFKNTSDKGIITFLTDSKESDDREFCGMKTKLKQWFAKVNSAGGINNWNKFHSFPWQRLWESHSKVSNPGHTWGVNLWVALYLERNTGVISWVEPFRMALHTSL